jgi:hypothetical protein
MALNSDDEDLLDEIVNEFGDGRKFAMLMGNYWHDLDRANRTPRTILYFHIWLLVAALMKAQREDRNRHEPM